MTSSLSEYGGNKGVGAPSTDLPFKTMLTELLVLHARLGSAHERELAELTNKRGEPHVENFPLVPNVEYSQGFAQFYGWEQLAVKAPYRPFKERPPPGRLEQVVLPISPSPRAPPSAQNDISRDEAPSKSANGHSPKELLSCNDNDDQSFKEQASVASPMGDALSFASAIHKSPSKVRNLQSQRSLKSASFRLNDTMSDELHYFQSDNDSPHGSDVSLDEMRACSHVRSTTSALRKGTTVTHDTLGTVGTPLPPSRRMRDTVEREDELRKMQALWAGMEDEDDVVQAYLDGQHGGKSTWRSKAFSMVYSNVFQISFAMAIMLNAVFLGVEVDYSAAHPHEKTPAILYVVGYAFVALFLVELLIRLFAEGMNFFCNAFWIWNWLDFIIVVASVFETLFDIIDLSNGEQDNTEASVGHIRLFRMIRLTRIIRVFRVARIVSLIRALHTLVYQIMGTLRSVFWALVLLTLTIYVFAMVFSQAATSHISSQDGQFIVDSVLLEYWGSLPRCMFTLYKSILGGVDWEHVVKPSSDMHESMVLLFVGYVSFTFFAMMNVMTGVFCQSAIESAQLDQDMVIQQHLLRKKTIIKKIRTLFDEIGKSNGRALVDGSRGRGDYITFRAFEKHLQEEKVNAYFESLGLDTSDAWSLFKLLDADENQEVDLAEFVEGCLRLRGQAKAVDVAKLSQENKAMRKKISTWMKTIDERLCILLDMEPKTSEMLPRSTINSLKNVRRNVSTFSRVVDDDTCSTISSP